MNAVSAKPSPQSHKEWMTTHFCKYHPDRHAVALYAGEPLCLDCYEPNHGIGRAIGIGGMKVV